jgi:hypothetical protein
MRPGGRGDGVGVGVSVGPGDGVGVGVGVSPLVGAGDGVGVRGGTDVSVRVSVGADVPAWGSAGAGISVVESVGTSEGMAVSADGPVETDAAADDGESVSVGNGVAATMTTGVGVGVAVKGGGLGVLVSVGVGCERATALYPIASPSMITSPAITKRKTDTTNKTLLRELMGNYPSDSEQLMADSGWRMARGKLQRRPSGRLVQQPFAGKDLQRPLDISSHIVFIGHGEAVPDGLLHVLYAVLPIAKLPDESGGGVEDMDDFLRGAVEQRLAADVLDSDARLADRSRCVHLTDSYLRPRRRPVLLINRLGVPQSDCGTVT